MRRILLAIVLISSCAVGCVRIPIYTQTERLVTFEIPERPAQDWAEIQEAYASGDLTEREKQIIDRTFELKVWGERMEAMLETYNEYADIRNRSYDKQGAKLGLTVE